MNKKTRRFGIISGILAFLLCLAGGLILIFEGGYEDNLVCVGIGLYFIGQAFFAGPMLIIYCMVNSE